MNRESAKKLSYKNEVITTAIISITDLTNSNNRFHKSDWLKHILWVKFDDVELSDKNAITDDDAKRIALFVNLVKDKVDRIVVHCDAGISRSSGVAGAIMKYLNGDDMPIFSNGRFCPNMTCYRKVLTALMLYVDEEELKNKEDMNINEWKLLQDD